MRGGPARQLGRPQGGGRTAIWNVRPESGERKSKDETRNACTAHRMRT